MENKLDFLGKIEKVNVPPFLYTRILHKLQNGQQTVISPVKQWGLAFAFLMLVALNVSILAKNYTSGKYKNETENLAKSLGLNSNNNLYNDQN
ncbi:MAG TPA: hypothetical protein VF273_00175 [Pelobium sp.]